MKILNGYIDSLSLRFSSFHPFTPLTYVDICIHTYVDDVTAAIHVHTYVHTYVRSVRKHTFSTCVGTRLGLWTKSDIDKGARNTESRVKLRRGWAEIVSGRFTFRSVWDGNLFRDTHTHTHFLLLHLRASCLELALSSLWFRTRSLSIADCRYSSHGLLVILILASVSKNVTNIRLGLARISFDFSYLREIGGETYISPPLTVYVIRRIFTVLWA